MITELKKKDYPEWLKLATVENEIVHMDTADNTIIWKNGIWKGGTWKGGIWEGGFFEGGIWEGGFFEGGVWKSGFFKNGVWRGGIWEGGTFEKGIWKDGVWENGVFVKGIWMDGIWKKGIFQKGIWENGTWKSGIFEGGTWKGGVWKKGAWRGGTWEAKEDQIIYMLATIGIMCNADGTLTGYKKSRANGVGCYASGYIHRDGEFFIEGADKFDGVCSPGIHVCSLPLAYTYFRQQENDELWEITFQKEDVVGFDHEKVRLKHGFMKKIQWPWLRQNRSSQCAAELTDLQGLDPHSM